MMMVPSNVVVNPKSLFNRAIVIFFKEFWVSNEEIGFKDILRTVLNHEYLTVKHGNQIEINIFES